MSVNNRLRELINSGALNYQQADNLLKQAGVTVQGGEGRVDNFLASNPQVEANLSNMLSAYGSGGQGMMPVGVEPLHQWEKQGYNVLANPQGEVQKYINPMASTFLSSINNYANKADSAIANGMKGFDAEEMKQYINPYTEEVTNRSVARLNENAEKMKQSVLGKMRNRGSATLGDLYGAQQLGDVAKETVSKTGDIIAEGNQAGWNGGIDFMKTVRANNLQGGSLYGGLGDLMSGGVQVAQGLTNDGYNTTFGIAKNQIGAGQAVRGFNQGLADRAMGAYTGQNTFNNNLTDQALSLFPTISQGGNTSTGYSSPTVQNNTAGNLANLGKGLAGIDFGNFSAVGANGPQQQNWLGQAAGSFGINF